MPGPPMVHEVRPDQPRNHFRAEPPSACRLSNRVNRPTNDDSSLIEKPQGGGRSRWYWLVTSESPIGMGSHLRARRAICWY